MKKIFYLLVGFLFSVAAQAAENVQLQSYIFNISYEDAQDAIGKALTEKLIDATSEGQTIEAVINGKNQTPLYSSNKPISVEVRGLREDSSLERWSASLVIISDDTVTSALPIAGRYMVMRAVPVLKNQVRSGDVIRESDVEVRSFPQARISSDTVTDVAEIVGRSPVRNVSPSRPVRSSEIAPPAIIKKNALVQMRYKTPNMEITTGGQALVDGAKGDVIEVRNTTSKKTVQAVVAEDGIVDVIVQGFETSQIMPVSANGVQTYAK